MDDTYKSDRSKIIEAYKTTPDFEFCCQKLNVLDEQKLKFEADTYLQSWLRLIDAEFKERVIANIWDVAENGSDKTRLDALQLLGKIYYPEKFNLDVFIDSNKFKDLNINLVGKDNNSKEPQLKLVSKGK